MNPTVSIELIVAVARHNAIGRGGDLLFHLSPDLKHFKEITSGHTVIMGRRTYESLPGGALPRRRNIVLSRSDTFHPVDAEVFPSLDCALDAVKPHEKVFIIGGGTVYKEALPNVSVIHLTEIDADAPDADTFFPEIPSGEFVTADITAWLEDPKSGLRYRFSTLVRETRHKKTMSELARIDTAAFKFRKKLPLTVILDNIRSLNNIGSIFRTADGFAIERIYLCGITSTPPSTAIHKTALGAEQSVEWRYFSDATEAIADLHRQGYEVAALEQVEGSLDLFDFTPDYDSVAGYGIVVGNEIEGISQLAVNACDFCLEIPQFGTKHSLNVAVSAALAMGIFFKYYYTKL